MTSYGFAWYRRRSTIPFAYKLAFYVAVFVWSIVAGWNVTQWWMAQ